MAEAEDVITDVARHATVFARDLWQRHRTTPDLPRTLKLTDVATRLDLLITSVFGSSYSIRNAQPPARPTLLARAFRRAQRPYRQQAIPTTDGHRIWLPPDSGLSDWSSTQERYRVAALQQAMRAKRGSAALVAAWPSPLQADVYLLLEAQAADEALANLLPGLRSAVDRSRRAALHARPPLTEFSLPRRPLERCLRMLLESDTGDGSPAFPPTGSPVESRLAVPEIIAQFKLDQYGRSERQVSAAPLLKDWWTGELHPAAGIVRAAAPAMDSADDQQECLQSARLERRPEIRDAKPGEDEDREDPGAWMVQAEESHQHAEDPLGLQRPTDRDSDRDAEEFGDLVSELAEARLVSTPGRPKEVLLSDDPPDARSQAGVDQALQQDRRLHYPEWDYRARAYQLPGATVRLLSPQQGPQAWVDEALAEHQSMLNDIRRNFEMLRARRVLHRKQVDGDDIDLDSYIDSYADFRAGSPMAEALYQSRRSTGRSIAITLLIDISGSTDGWVSTHRRIIDVEREALLLVCIALDGMGEPYSVQAFSGEGRHAVTVRQIKRFDEHYSNDVALRISALQPERYTRAGAALRHATAELMQVPADHRLLLLLSDGKPNDNDHYEGRYGVEDMRKAVIEARLQGVYPFCLTIDRQAANYLPTIFDQNQYALLPQPEQLPRVLLEWLRRLISH